METDFRLPVLLLLPLVGAVVAPFLPDGRTTRRWALLVTVATALYGFYLALAFKFDAGAAIQFGYRGSPVAGLGLSLSLGIDSISLWLGPLTVLLMPLSAPARFGSIRERQKEDYARMLALTVGLLR